jgi:hypothetical protein
MFMGISPGNVGTMDYLDVYRRESQRDFGDSAGTMSRAIVEGLFGVHPDALAGTLTVSPGFPADWTHARMTHPDVSVDFVRTGQTDSWEIRQSGDRFHSLTFRLPAVFASVSSVQVNGKNAPWTTDPDAAGRPVLKLVTPASESTRIRIVWSGEPVSAQWMARAQAGETAGDFRRMSGGSFEWWAPVPRSPQPPTPATRAIDWRAPVATSHLEAVDLSAAFNDRVTAIFAMGKYLRPRSSGVSLELPWQGAGAWAGHLNTLPVIDDRGLRKVAGENGGRLTMPNGVFFATPAAADANNIAFTSQWSDYPAERSVGLDGRASHAYFLMAGSTNFMQTHMDNGEVVVAYTDGSSARLALRNPETWWPIEQDYFIDDYQFPLAGPLPPRVDLRTGTIRLLALPESQGKGREVPGGAATVLDLALDPGKQLKSLTVRTLTNDSVIGLMSVTLQRP